MRRRSARPWSIAAAASLIVLVGVLAHVATAWFSGAIETEPGEWRVQVLADGSTVRIGPRLRRGRLSSTPSGYCARCRYSVQRNPRDDWMVVTVTEGVVAALGSTRQVCICRSLFEARNS